MKKRQIIAFLVTAIAAVALADTPQLVPVARIPHKQGGPAKNMLERLNRHAYKRTGGGVEKPGSCRGKIVFLNMQKRVPQSEFESVVKEIFKLSEFPMEFATGDGAFLPDKAMTEHKANVVFAIIDDPAQPTSLIAPEERWAMMNVAKLSAGYKGKEVSADVLASRSRKELIRIVGGVCGGGSTQFVGNCLTVTSVDALDTVGDFIPGDLKPRLIRSLDAMGVNAPRVVTYLTACQEGWAPQPTNDIQRAVWDKVHTLPTNPITIKHEPKNNK